MSAPLPAGQAGALAVEHMDPGPAQAGWLAAAAGEATSLDEYGLAGVAIAARQLASWAHCGRARRGRAACRPGRGRRPEIGLAADGRPARLCRDAVGQISLALMLTDHSATAWADLAVTLCWRLPATGAGAGRRGRIDLARARVIAEATSVLGEDAARAVEAKILPEAGRQTTAQLRARLRRAVIAADPDGRRAAPPGGRAARRRSACTPTTTAPRRWPAPGCPRCEAAAAMARITAIARAMKAAGHGGGLDLHRAQVMLGLLLGTLPYIPPPGGTPEPQPPGDDAPVPAVPVQATRTAAAPAARSTGRGMTCPPRATRTPRPATARMTTTAATTSTGRQRRGRRRLVRGRAGAAVAGPGRDPARAGPPPASRRTGGRCPGCWMSPCPGPPWPACPPRPGCWAASAPSPPPRPASSPAPPQADPAAQWRIIVTSPAGQAIAVTRIRRRRARDGPGPARDGPPPGTGLVGRITLTITQDTIRRPPAGRPPDVGPGPPAGQPGPGRRRDRRRRAAGRRHGAGPGAGPGRSRRRGRRLRPCRRVAGLPAAAAAARARDRAGCDLPQPRLPAARLARRPGPHPGLRRPRADLPLQPRRRLPPRPPAQAAPPLEAGADPARRVHLDYSRRAHLHHRPRHPPHLKAGRHEKATAAGRPDGRKAGRRKADGRKAGRQEGRRRRPNGRKAERQEGRRRKAGRKAELMGWDNPPLPWREFERRLSWGGKGGKGGRGQQGAVRAVRATRPAGTPRR